MWKKFMPPSFLGAGISTKIDEVCDIPHMGNVQQCFLRVMRDNAAYAPEHGIIHVGAHRCEEKPYYENEIGMSNILWIDGNDDLCRANPHIVNAIVAERDGDEVEFIITSNEAMSSSILELKHHLVEHPDCRELKRIRKKTITLDSLVTSLVTSKKYDMLVMDVQGAELLVLRGAAKVLEGIKCIITEVNTKELYAGCAQIEDLDAFLGERGFVRVCTDMTRHGWGDALYLRKLITVQLFAGLGNRLFQLAFLYAIAKETNRMPVIYDDFIERCDDHFKDPKRYDAFYAMFPRCSARCTMGVHVIKEDPKKPCVYVDYTSHVLGSSSPIVKFHGYFQSPRFFKEYANEIRDIFVNALDFDESWKNKNIDNFIHVRGRDFITTSKTTHRLDNMASYYEKALKATGIVAETGLVITDDLNFVESFDILRDFRASQVDDLDALSMMTRCKGAAITANSTFSWWGAFLSDADKIYTPRPFLVGGLECRDIYGEGVKRIDAADVKQAGVFDNIVVARLFARRYLHIILVRHVVDAWFCDNEILINGQTAQTVKFVSKEDHADIYNDMCIIKHDVTGSDGELNIMLTLNGVTRSVKVEEYDVPQKHRLVAMTLFKDDKELIEPYVRHHRKLGIDHFFMYYNGNLASRVFPNLEDVTYIEWPHPYKVNGLHVAQLGAMTDMLAMAKHVAEYVLFSDLDEYLIWRPGHASLGEFIARNSFKVYACLNNFIMLEHPEQIGLQIDDGRYEKTFQMSYPTRSKCIVNSSAMDVMGVHQPMKDVTESEICVLAAPMCELLHVCNLRGRHHTSFGPDTLAAITNATNYIKVI